MTTFDEIDGKAVHQAFPQFYDQQGRFFEIIHKGQEIGFLGVRPVGIHSLSPEEGEVEVYVFPQYRNTLTKGLVFNVLDFPKSLGFRRVVMTTSRSKLLRGLHFLVQGAKLDVRLKNGKPYFVRHYP